MSDREAGGSGAAHRRGAPRPTLAEKINRLFEVMHPRDRGRQSNEEVAAAISARGGPTISASYLWLLRTGKRDNPTVHHLEALAEHFGVTGSYFFDDDVAAEVERELDLIRAMRDAGVKQLALRASGLTPDVLSAIALMVEQARKAQGLPDLASDSNRPTVGPPRRRKTEQSQEGEQ